jgi:hypothetical protein
MAAATLHAVLEHASELWARSLHRARFGGEAEGTITPPKRRRAPFVSGADGAAHTVRC